MKTLRIAKGLSLPVDFVSQSAAILARKRAGKSYTARKLVEQLMKAGEQVIIIDPKGDWHGILSSADGKSVGYPVTIFGGEHQHVPLEVRGGELVAKIVVEERLSMLLDLSEFRQDPQALLLLSLRRCRLPLRRRRDRLRELPPMRRRQTVNNMTSEPRDFDGVLLQPGDPVISTALLNGPDDAGIPGEVVEFTSRSRSHVRHRQ